MRKTALYYTCNAHPAEIEDACRRQLEAARGDCDLVCVSRGVPVPFGDVCLTVQGEREPLTMHRQILRGLEYILSGCVFLCESDVLYHPSHFDFEPEREDVFYYNTNVWRMRYDDGHAVWTDDLQQVSGCCAMRDLLLAFYRQRVEAIRRDGFDRHYEPGPKTGPWRAENRRAAVCNVDIRHGRTLTRSKWSPAEFRNKRYARGWQETDDIPGWGRTGGRVAAFLSEVGDGAE